MSMRPVRVRLSAAGFSSWIPLNPTYSHGGCALAGVMSSNGNLTWSFQHTFDDIYAQTGCVLTRSGTSLTVTKSNHGLDVDSWAMISGGTIWDGQYAVASITDQNNFVVTVANSGALAGFGQVQTARVFDHADLAGETASADGNYAFAPVACRGIITSFTAGYIDFEVVSSGE